MKKLNIFLIGLLLVAQNILGPISIVSAEASNSNALNAGTNEINDNPQSVDLEIPMDSDTKDDTETSEDTTKEPVSEEDEMEDSDENKDSEENTVADHDENVEETDVEDANTDEEMSTDVSTFSEDADEGDIAPLFVGAIEEAKVNFSKLVVNGVDIENQEDAHKVEPKIGDDVSVYYTFEIKDPHVDYEVGSTFSFELPSALLVFDANALSGEFTDDDVKFKYSTAGNTVTVELTEGTIGEGSTYSGKLNFHAKFGQNGAEDGLEQTVRIPIAGGQELEFVFTFQPSKSGEAISKKGTAKIAEDGKRYIEWELWVNTAGAKLANAKVEDKFGEGHELDGDITVEKYAIGLSGVGDKVDSKTVNKFPVTLDDGHHAYKLTYKSLVTRVAEKTTESFTNNAALTNGDKTSTAKATATHTYGTKLDKSLVGGDKYKLQWSIKYNYFGSKFNSKTLTDTIKGNHKIIKDSIKVYSVTIDVSGNGTKGGLVNPQPSATVAPDGKSFTIDLKSPNGEAYLIEYETESTEEFVTGSGNIINEVQYDKEKDDSRHNYSENIFHKSRASINYDKKEITWTIRVNVERDMKNFVIEDLFKSYEDGGTRQTLINPDSPFTFSDKAPNPNTYKLIDNDPTKGFTLNFGDLAKGTSFTITYKTKFDILPNGTAYGEYKNTATATWEGETTKDEGWKIEKSAQYNPGTSPTGNNGYKYGSFNHVNQVFNWTVGVNINKQQINGSTLVDEIGDGHKLVPGTIKIHKLQLENNDLGYPVGNDLASEFNVVENKNLDGFTINFNKDTTDAYIITYQTKDDDNIIGQPDGSNHYENDAAFTTIDDKTFKLKASVSVLNANELISKSPQTNPDDETITWTIDVNKSHSKLSNIVLTDVMSDNQLILPETFKISEITMDENGKLIYSNEWESVIPVIDDETNSFSLDLGEVNQVGYRIQYKTFFLGAHLDTFSNKASINYEGVEEGIESESGVDNEKYRYNQSSGEISSKKGTLEIHKVGFNQLTGERVNLEGITFHLYNKTGTVKLAEAVTGKDGKLIFENVRYGKYKVKEVEGTPEGYIPLDQNGVDVTINDETNILEDGKSVEVINHEDVDLENACKFFRVTVKDADGKSLPENTEVTISNGDFELIKTTGAHGEINYPLSELPAGAYKVFVDDVEYGEVQVSYEGDICEDAVQIAPSCDFFTVTIYNADKKPHSGADISIKENRDGEVIANGTTNSNGEIEIESKDLPAGKYEVYEGQTKIGEIAVSYVDGDCEATVNMLPIEACEVFTVTVKDADENPVADTTVTIVVNGEDKTFTTGKNGQFNFPYGEIEAGTYEVQLDGVTIGEIDVSFAGEDCNAQVQLAPTCELFTVTVNDADGNPVVDKEVVLVGENQTVTKTTGENGQITFAYGEIGAGTYEVQLDGAMIDTIDVSFAGGDCQDQVQLAPTCELFTVTINDADRNPVAETEVVLVGENQTVTKTTDENGQITFAYGEIEAGTYEVQLDGATIGEIDVSFAGEDCNDQIQIAPKCPIFEVTIKDADGNVSPATTVTVKDKDGNVVATSKTDKNGKIQVPSEAIPAGTYIVYEGEVLIGEIEVSHIDNCETEVQAAPACELFTVTVKDADNKVRPNVSITIKDLDGNEIATEETDEDGKIQVSSKELPAGKYKVYEGETFIDEIVVTHIDNCETEVQYAPACPIFEVVVKDADGNGLQDTTITIKDKEGNVIITSKTGDDGKVQVPSNELPSGKYDVYEGDTFIGEIKVSHVENCETEVQFAPACDSFTIIAKDEDGQVRSNVSITIKDLDGNEIATEETDEDGKIQVSSKDLPAGIYVVYEGDTLIGEIKVSHVENCETEIQLAPACELFTVTVKNADEKVLQDTAVTIKDKDGNEIITAVTDEDGKIQAPSNELPAGKYEVYEGGTLIGEIVVSHIDNCEAEVQYAPTCPIFEVIVKDADDNAHPNSTITIKDKEDNEIITAETDEHGKIQVPSNDLPAGTYKVYKGDTFIGEIEVSHVDNCETEIQLAPTCELFTITVNNADGKPQANTEVTIIVDEEESITKTTDENGQFTFEYGDIEAGAYEVQLDGTTIGEIEVSFAGEACVDEIQIAPSCPFFEVTVKDENGKERSNVTVTIKDKDGNDVYTAETDENGKIHVPSNDLPAGNYDVYEGDTFIGEIEISYLDHCETEVQAAPSCPVFTLTITDHDKKPLAGAEIVVKDVKGEIAATGKTDKNGEVTFDKPFTAGNYFVFMDGVEVGEITVSSQDCTASIALKADEDKPVTPGKPVDPKKPTEPSKPSKTDKTGATKTGSKLPQTGEELFTYMIVLGVLFLAGGAFILFRQRRKASEK